ncbi:MAG TPA: Rieske 2Fe-2S domain-containing protein [Solirubrobacteraceae bacterium]|nr:Rieske 2Fe-2S domain-containing protein [Solirubrobacteraceae bacterium]
MDSTTMDTWTEVGRAEDIPLWEGRRVTVGDRRIAVFRTEDGLHAVGADCPHADGPLQDGLVADGCVTCPLHGWRFSLLTGEQLGAIQANVAAALDVYEVAERDGTLLLRVSAERLAPAA